MSARKLCLHIAKTSNTTLFRKYVTNTKALDRKMFDHQSTVMNHSANYSQALGCLTKDQAHDLVFRLNDEERKILLQTLDHYNVSIEKDGLECKFIVLRFYPLINLMSAADTQRSYLFLPSKK